MSSRSAAGRWVVFNSLVRESASNLRARRTQALLSAFGIATGIAAVVLLVSLVSGIHRLALKTFNSAGGSMIDVNLEADPSVRDPRGFPLTLRLEDIDSVLASSRHFGLGYAENFSSPIVRGRQVEGRTFFFDPGLGAPVARTVSRPMRLSAVGLTDAGFEAKELHLASGRLPLPSEYDEGGRVVVLGAGVVMQLFGGQQAVSDTLVLGDWVFRVIGTLQWVGQPTGEFRVQQDRMVYVPFRTNATTFLGNVNASALHFKLKEPGTNVPAIADARSAIAIRQLRTGESVGQLRFSSVLDRLAELNLVLGGLKLLVGLVGGIGLFVGAVGVANVLLVSVRERTQEIGVRRAIGATRRDIFLSFLMEALAITLMGGFAGIFVAWVLTIIADFIPAIPDGAEPHISLVTAFVAVSILVMVGIAAGVGPARRAASVFPSEALRAE